MSPLVVVLTVLVGVPVMTAWVTFVAWWVVAILAAQEKRYQAIREAQEG